MKINDISGIGLPPRLQAIPNPPKEIWLRGHLPDEQRTHIAIVGTRRPTPYGRQVTSELAMRLAERGGVIVSGLAHGIDGIAHEAALKVGGITLAVLANGLDTVYPAVHRSLAQRILTSGGAIMSEYRAGTPPLQHRFLERNRLVSGLSDVVIVTEASSHSGTMNTVSHALLQGKDVYAVPGPITSPMSAGCNLLISQGATPIVSIEAFVEELLPTKTEKQAALLAQTAEEQRLIDLIAEGITDGDALHAKSGLETTAFLQTMTMLELRGVIRPLGANHWGL